MFQWQCRNQRGPGAPGGHGKPARYRRGRRDAFEQRWRRRPIRSQSFCRVDCFRRDDCSGLVVLLNHDWRVIRCCDHLQWVLRRRGSPKKPPGNNWRGRSYCQTSEALIRCAREYAGAIEPAAAVILAALPARIDFDRPTGGESLRRPLSGSSLAAPGVHSPKIRRRP
jgi:hypothetical protein